MSKASRLKKHLRWRRCRARSRALAVIAATPSKAAEAREELRAAVRQGGEGQEGRLGAGMARRSRIRMDARHEGAFRRLRNEVRRARPQFQVGRAVAGRQHADQRKSGHARRPESERHLAGEGTEAGDGGRHLCHSGQHGLEHADRRLCRRRRQGYGPHARARASSAIAAAAKDRAKSRSSKAKRPPPIRST